MLWAEYGLTMFGNMARRKMFMDYEKAAKKKKKNCILRSFTIIKPYRLCEYSNQRAYGHGMWHVRKNGNT
jgi:hypothetical protein